jgi:hypothetical protein
MNQTFINFEETDTGQQVQFIDGRYYTRDNEHWYPGVTTILGVLSKGKQYENWLKSNGFNADYLAKVAMEQGSKVHEAIQLLLEGQEVSVGNKEKMFYTREEWQIISRFIDFCENFNPETIAIEKVLVSDILRFGSQLDYVCTLNNQRWVIDHKTGSIYDTAYMQVASYVQLWNEFFPKEPIERAGILHLESGHRGRDKSGKEIQGEGWKLIEVTDLDRHWTDFQHLQAIWERQNPNYKPFLLKYPASYKL